MRQLPVLLAVAVAIPLPACMTGVGGIPDADPETEPPPKPQPQPQPTTPLLDSIAHGTIRPIGPFTNLAGRALLVRKLDGSTLVSIALTGAAPNTMYTTHVHAAPCQYGGGGHYKIDPAIVEVIETNELWVKGRSSPTGALAADATFTHLARGNALSAVVHDPTAGAKMACADLIADDVATQDFHGTIAPFAAATQTDLNIAGTISAKRTATSTMFSLSLTGLDVKALAYGSHIHAEPCTVATGGGHYKLDTSVVETIEANEIWLPITSYATTGTATATLTVPHGTRTDAQSIVVHRTLTITPPNAPKVACANLTRMTPKVALETTGSAIALPGANGASLTGSAILTRKLTGVTEIAVVLSGLAPSTKYQAHVHNQPCSVDAGGVHYKFDRNIAETIPSNEMLFEMLSDANGAAHGAMWAAKTAAADAMSVVVHGEMARIACFDLQ